ncbi:MAG: LssY C-terminal domain-containing protein [Deltaproteobacteria bacterium]|nr:LssY C-terminal domain-containing protein [Deltaproteobacteria bacterium]
MYHKPRSFFDVPFQERSQSKVNGDVRVTVAVLSDEESRQLFGVNLAGQGMQPVWIRVQNADSSPYWLMSSGLDPDYFSPLESAYAFHGTFSGSLNNKIDDQFRVMSFRNPIAPGTSVSGFIFANRDEGIKVVDIDLISYGKAKFFTFFVSVPGIRADYHEVDFENLYLEDEIVNLDEDDLRAALEKLPCCATNKDGTKKGDPLNLVLIGSREDISAAFVRRGWLPAEQTHGKAVWKTIKSFLFGSRYRYSPVSPLYLYGRQQDFAGQKPRHTVHQRNHLRAWLSPIRYQGKPVWIGQISRDIGVRFTFKSWPPVTHKIDPDIDEARYAFGEDLIYSQQLAKGGYVKGVGAASRLKPRHNLTGDPYFTDGYRLVLVFDRRPRSFLEIERFDWENPVSNKLKRLTVDQRWDLDEVW